MATSICVLSKPMDSRFEIASARSAPMVDPADVIDEV